MEDPFSIIYVYVYNKRFIQTAHHYARVGKKNAHINFTVADENIQKLS